MVKSLVKTVPIHLKMSGLPNTIQARSKEMKPGLTSAVKTLLKYLEQRRGGNFQL
jgi:hypothetical protein